MKKTIGLMALLISSAAVMVPSAMARDRDDEVCNVPVYTTVHRDVRVDWQNNYRTDYRVENRNDHRDVRRDTRQIDARGRTDYGRR